MKTQRVWRAVLTIVMGLMISAVPALASDVEVALVALTSPSSSDTRQSLPSSITAAPVGQDYYVEVWASDVGTTNTGLTSVYVDLTFSPSSAATAKSVTHGGIYTVFPSGTISSGKVDELGGSSLTAAGIAPEWARSAIVRMRADAVGSVTYSLAESATGIAALGRGLIPWSQTGRTGVTVQHVQTPSITTHPTSQTVCAGDSVTFTVTATGTPPLSYQWRKNGGNISGATASSYTINSTTTGNAGSYTCVVSNICGSATSNAAVLTVNTTPIITDQPDSQNVCAGESVTFTVSATGGGTFTYQWRKDGGNISGATGSSYTINTVSSAHAGSYDCVVTNSCGSTTSQTAILTVNAAPSITTHPTSRSACPGESATFTVSATGTAPLSYQWRKDGCNISGATGSSYTIDSVTARDAAEYDCVVSNTCGSATSNAGTLTVNSPPVITGYPQNQTVCQGASATFTITATGSSPLSYQWRKNGSNISGATNSTYTITSVTASHVGNYDCVVSNTCGSVTSNIASLTVNTPPTITAQPTSQTACGGDTVVFIVTANGTAPLTYQWRKNGTNITGATSSSYVIASAVPADAGSYTCRVTNGCGSTTSSAATLTINAAPVITDDPDSQTCCEGESVTFTVTATGSGSLSYQWRHNGVDIPGAIGTGYTISSAEPSDAGNYHCAVTNNCGSTISNPAVLTVGTAPIIGYSPEDRAVCEGDSVTFTVYATGTSPFTYQWRKNGNEIQGVTNSSFTIDSVDTDDAAYYECVVTNSCGSSISGAAALTVKTAPTITQNPVSQTVNEGESITLTVTATGAGLLSYQWRKDSQNIPEATASTYPIIAATSSDAGTYECHVTNCCGIATSEPSILTVVSTIIYVDAAAAGANTGASWKDALDSLADALDLAATSGQPTVEIRVATGTYRPDIGSNRILGDRTETFDLSDGLVLMGGYAGTAGTDPDVRDFYLYQTILSGDIGAVGDHCDNSHHVIRSVGVIGGVLDGVVITAGNANTVGHSDGAGLYIADSTITVTHCTFQDNDAGNGAAIANIAGNLTMRNCILANNRTVFCGGGMYNTDSGNPSIANCTFTSNSAGDSGGGIYNLSGNLGTSNSIFWANSEGGIADESAQIHIAGGTITANHNCIQGLTGALAGIGNIDLNPCFIDAPAGDYHLRSRAWWWNRTTGSWDFDIGQTSPCIDAGNPGSPLRDELTPSEVDPSQPNAAMNTRINMGAYGGTAQASLVPQGYALLTDSDNSGTVDFADWALAGDCWLNACNEHPFDFDRSGTLDFKDLDIFTTHWLSQTTWLEP